MAKKNQAGGEADEKAKAEADAKLKAETDAKAKAEADAKAKADADAKEKEPKPAKNLDVLGGQLQTLMQDAASKFIKENKDDVAKLGEDVVRAIFAQQFIATMPALMKLPDNASVEMRIAHEQNNAARTEVLQIISTAEREDAARVARIRGNASSAVGKIAGTALSLVGGFLAKAALGG